jgi:hypothetical protein
MCLFARHLATHLSVSPVYWNPPDDLNPLLIHTKLSYRGVENDNIVGSPVGAAATPMQFFL